MLETEQLSPKIELPPRETVARIAGPVAVCCSGFSKGPFFETYAVNDVDVSGLLLNTKTTRKLIEDLLDSNFAELIRHSEFEEEACVDKRVLLSHIENTLSDPMTEWLHKRKKAWMDDDDISSLKKARAQLLKDKKDHCKVSFCYPLTTLFDTYFTTSESPRSLLVLGYQNGVVPSDDKDVDLLTITPETLVSNDICPLSSGRYMTLNHPSVLEEELINVSDWAVKETKYYLDSVDQRRVANAVSPHLYTTFLGEVAKIPDDYKRVRAIHSSGLRYLEILTASCSNKPELDWIALMPQQMLYMSLPGTAVATESKIVRGESRLFQSLKVLLKPSKLEYREEILTFSNANGNTVLFGIIKQV